MTNEVRLLRRGTGHPGRRRRRSYSGRELLTALSFLAPWLIGISVFYLGPLLASFAYSLTDYPIIGTPKFAGLDNYRSLVDDRQFITAIRVTVTYTVFSLVIYVGLALLIAVLCNGSGRSVAMVRLLVFLPSLIPLFAAAVLWGWLFNRDFGLVNYVLDRLGLPTQGFFQDAGQALPMTIAVGLWGIGGAFLTYLSGLQSIPLDLYEAITVDGGGALRRFWHVTLPMLSPVIMFNTVIGVVLSFQVFDIAWVLTKGGPADRTLFWVLLIYRKAFEEFQMGYASALAWLLFIAVAVCTALIFRVSRHWVFYASRQ